MKSEKEIQHLIDEWTTRSIDFLEKGERGDIRKQISAPNQLEMNSYLGKKCPTCTEKMTRKNPKTRLTTEHIVPRCLGGNNIRVNLVAMCHHCNQYRNAVMMVFLPPLPDMRGTKLEDSVKADLSRFIEWSLRTIHTPDSKRIDAELSELFAEYSAPINNGKKAIKRAKKRAKGKTTKSSKKPQSIASDDVLEVLKEILETQKAILERLQKSPLHRFKDWIIGLFPKKKTRSPIEVKSKRRSSHRHRSLKKNEMEMTSNNNTSKHIHKYFCPTCNTLFTKWKQAKLHKKETGHGCRVCDECGAFFGQERFRQAHEDDTGHTNYSGNFYGQKRMSIKHYLPEERLVTMDTLGKNEIDVEGFSKLIEILLGEDEVSAPNIGQRVRRYQKENDWPRLGSKAFLDAFGIPSNTGLVNAIVSIMGDRVTLIGEDSVTRSIMMNLKKTTLKTESIPESEELSKPKQPSPPSSPPQYPIIEGLNNSKGTFRLPRDPGHLGAALIWIAENAHSHSTFSEMREEMASKTNIAKSRVHYLLTKISVIKGGENWLATTATSNMDAIVIVDALQTHVYQICLIKQIEVTEQYTEYFSLARNYILGKAEEV